MIKRLLSFSALVLAIGALAAPAAARDFVLSMPTTPMAYRYAACAFSLEEATGEEQIATCQSLREELINAADEFLLKFDPRDRSIARRNLVWAFDEMEREAVLAREQRKTVPPAIVAYLQCVGERVMATEDFCEGVAVDFIGIEDPCTSEHILSVEFVQTEQEVERIQLLYQHFAIQGRFVDNRRLGAGIASTGDGANARNVGRRPSLSRAPAMPRREFTQGFLVLHRLPADEVPKND